VKATGLRPRLQVSADGTGLVSRGGALLLTRTARVTGLDAGLSAGLARWRAPRAVHDPGKVACDLAVVLALGGDCLADATLLRAEPQLFGPVASDPVISRLVSALAADPARSLRAIRGARAAARRRAWELAGTAAPGADGGLVTVDLDATIVIAHSEKENAAPTWKKTFGFHPLCAFADHGAAGTGEPLAIVLRPGNAGANTAADHIEVTRLALAQLPPGRKALIRTDAAGGTHEFLAWLHRRRLHYSVSRSPCRAWRRRRARSRPGHGRPPMTRPASSGPAHGSPSSPACSTWRAGQPGCGSSPARSARTPARSCGSPTSTATA
jgi:hypothetical protein